MPSFSITPASTTEPAVGAWVWASGSQVCSGKIGTLTANAIGEREEQPSPGDRREVGALGDLDEVEGHPPEVVAGEHRRGDDARRA